MRSLLRGAARSVAVHCAMLGATLFALSRIGEPVPAAPAVVVPASEVRLAEADFLDRTGREPNESERTRLLDALIDRELLYRHALELGLQDQPVVHHRLAQVAEFVGLDSGAAPVEERAEAAMALGLDRSDRVVRRLLVDGAARLIRAGARVRDPGEASLRAYLDEHADRFRRPQTFRIRHVLLSRVVRGESAPGEARSLVVRLNERRPSADDLGRLGDPSPVPNVLPSLPERELERRFGRRFVERLTSLEPGRWQGPVRSRYGEHAVLVEEHRPARSAALDEVRAELREVVRQSNADVWLAVRLRQLRDHYDVSIERGGEHDAS